MEKILKIIPLLICSILFFILPIQTLATGDTGWGAGGKPTQGGAAGWVGYSGAKWSGVKGERTSAWEQFSAEQAKQGKFKDLPATINSLNVSNGFKNPDGSYMALAVSCMRSQYIWIYADTSTKEWYTRAGKNDVNPPTGMKGSQEQTWNKYLGLGSDVTGWGKSPGPVIVCSGTFSDPVADKPEITLKANSGTFKYDGSPKTVKGFKHTAGKLIKGHVIDAKAERSEVERGTYPVTFQYAKILKDGKDVTKTDYEKVTTIDGTLKITREAKEPEEEEFYRCIPAGSDNVKEIIVENILRVEPVAIPETAGMFLYPEEIAEYTSARDIMDSPPNVGDVYSSWMSWKSSVQAVGNEREIALKFDDYHIDAISTYGGVLDILIEHKRENLDVVFCQPQIRTKYFEPIYDWEGYIVGWYPVYTPWVDEGEKIITDVNGPTETESLEFSYQILAVNCNAEEFKQLLGALGGKVAKSNLIEKVGSGILQTKIEEHSPSNLTLGRTTSGGIIGKTGTPEFYTDGTTCQENGMCTADKLMSYLKVGHHDAVNNHTPNGSVSAPLFTYFNPKENDAIPGETEQGHGLAEGSSANDKNIVFFRDNVNRVVRADVWRLLNSDSGIIIDETKPAEATFVKLFEGGSPEIGITTIQPLHDGLDFPYAEGYIDSENESHNDWQDNGTTKLTNNPSYEEYYPRSINRFNFKSQWTSDEKDPYKLGLAWVYTVTLERNTVTEVTNTSTTFEKAKTYGVEVACKFYNIPGSQNAIISKQPHVNTAVYPQDVSWDANDSIKVIFSRSVSEKRDITETNKDNQR